MRYLYRHAVLAVLNVSLIMPSSLFAEGSSETDLKSMPLSGFVDVVSLEDLVNMVVTDTKVLQRRNTVTQNITVINSNSFEKKAVNNRNLAELMRYTSGQFVNVLSRNDANWGSYAGLGPKYNTYLLDGLPIDSFVDPMSLDSWAIERIEIQKGPASVLYSNYLTMDFAGNESPLAGTTNLILKDRVDMTMTKAEAGYGSYNTFNGRVYHQGREGRFSYFLGGGAESSDYKQYGAQGSWLQTVDDPNYTKLKGYGKVIYALGRDDHVISLFGATSSHKGDQGRPNRDFQHAYGTLNFSYSNQINSSMNVQVKSGQRNYERRFGSDNYPPLLSPAGHSATRQRIRPLDVTVSYRHWEDSLLTFGLDHQDVLYETDSISVAGVASAQNRVKGKSLGFYLQEKVQLGDWVVRAGIRRNKIDHTYTLLAGNVPAETSASWAKNLWSFGARYNISDDFSLYGNVGTSFMVPAAKQIGGTTTVGSGLNGQLPNPGLKPEDGLGYDLGMDWRVRESIKIGVRGFLNKITGAIVDNVVSVVPSQTLAGNAGDASSRGVEFDLTHQFSDDTSWFANLTLVHSKIEDPINADQNGTEIPFVPDRVANLGLITNTVGDITLAGYYHWVGKYWDSASRAGRTGFGNYGVVNMRLQKEIMRSDATTLGITIDLNNLTNRRFDMPWGFRDTGFNAYAGLNAAF